jgi:hypothetical protein
MADSALLALYGAGRRGSLGAHFSRQKWQMTTSCVLWQMTASCALWDVAAASLLRPLRCRHHATLPPPPLLLVLLLLLLLPPQLKPVQGANVASRYVRSLLVVPERRTAALFSAKIPLSVFRLQFVLGYNWERHAPSLDYRHVRPAPLHDSKHCMLHPRLPSSSPYTHP